MSLNEAVFLEGGKGKTCLSGEKKRSQQERQTQSESKMFVWKNEEPHFCFLKKKTNNETKDNTFSVFIFIFMLSALFL